MKWLGFIGLFLFGVIVGFAVCLYWQGKSPIEAVTETFLLEKTEEPKAEEEENAAASNTNYKLERSIPLRDLPLSDSQKKTAASFGIDVDTFIITPAMIVCAEGKLGKSRLDAIIAGSGVSFMESMSLMGCLSAG